MPIQVNRPDQESTVVTDGGAGGDFSNFMQMLMRNPNIFLWMQRMLENMGYGVTEPGQTQAQTNIAQAQSSGAVPPTGVDPFGANWAPGMPAQSRPLADRRVAAGVGGGGQPFATVSDWKKKTGSNQASGSSSF